MGDVVMEEDQLQTLEVFVGTNRADRYGHPAGMDGWNEIIGAYCSNRHKGSDRELANVDWVSSFVRDAMNEQGWRQMRYKEDAVPCSVDLLFVERDRRRDIGNIHGGAKYVLDALTQRHKLGCGAIYDDSQRWLKDVTYAVAINPEGPGIQITVRELEPRRRGLRKEIV